MPRPYSKYCLEVTHVIPHKLPLLGAELWQSQPSLSFLGMLCPDSLALHFLLPFPFLSTFCLCFKILCFLLPAQAPKAHLAIASPPHHGFLGHFAQFLVQPLVFCCLSICTAGVMKATSFNLSHHPETWEKAPIKIYPGRASHTCWHIMCQRL